MSSRSRRAASQVGLLGSSSRRCARALRGRAQPGIPADGAREALASETLFLLPHSKRVPNGRSFVNIAAFFRVLNPQVVLRAIRVLDLPHDVAAADHLHAATGATRALSHRGITLTAPPARVLAATPACSAASVVDPLLAARLSPSRHAQVPDVLRVAKCVGFGLCQANELAFVKSNLVWVEREELFR